MELFVLTYLQSQYFWTSAAFVVLLVVMTRVVVPAVLATLDARAAKIAADLDAAAAAKNNAETQLAEYTAHMQAARKEAAQVISQARAEAEALAKTRIAHAEDELARKAEDERKTIEHAKTEALRSVRAEVAEIAMQVAEKLLKASVDSKLASQLADAALAKGLNS